MAAHTPKECSGHHGGITESSFAPYPLTNASSISLLDLQALVFSA